MNVQITESEDLLALADALECAIAKTDDELKRKRAQPYTRALEAQRTRYQSLLDRVQEK